MLLRLVVMLVRYHWHDELDGVSCVEGWDRVRAAFPELDEWDVGSDGLQKVFVNH